jgi:formylglycine-generating enzyme required for sulfatase activity
MSTPTIGIDFGTTTSSMAWVDPGTGKAEMLKNAEGEEKTPSVVYFGAELMLVGTPAEQMLDDPQEGRRVVASVKRELANAPTLGLPGRRVKAVEVAAAVFAKLKRDAEDLHFQEPVTRAVITCPAAFDVMEREAIEAAARLAGFAEVRSLEEPVAAALAYSRAGLGVGRHVLVYDLGGGTFDLALLREEAGGFALALEPKGLRRCGGDDFDQALYDYCDEEAERQWGHPLCDGGRDLRFLRDCRRRKENLSAQDKVLFSSLVGEGRLFRHSLTRELFEGLIGSRIDTTVRLTGELVRAAEGHGLPVETVVLIGGSSRIPLVQRRLKEALPVEPRRWQHQDVAVALGAAYFAQGLWKSLPASASVPKSTSRPVPEPSLDHRAVLTPQDIHGWSADKVQALQRAVVEALWGELVFRDRLQDGSKGPEMVVIPPGSYVMGSAKGDDQEGAYLIFGDAQPQHRVTIARPFAIGRYTVTFDEYDRFCMDTAREKPDDKRWGRGLRPVINVSWDDAIAYCDWLSKQTDRTYRLPSEAEWEYAARAGTATCYWWGDAVGFGNANLNASGNPLSWAWRSFVSGCTSPVGSFKPNPFGLYDTVGNVMEWAQDAWHDSYAGAPSDGSAWLESSDATTARVLRVLRGGSWCNLPRAAGVSFRFFFHPVNSCDYVGVRLAQDL